MVNKCATCESNAGQFLYCESCESKRTVRTESGVKNEDFDPLIDAINENTPKKLPQVSEDCQKSPKDKESAEAKNRCKDSN